MKKEFLKMSEVIEKLNMSRTSFYWLRKRGFVEPVIKNPIRWREKDIDGYLTKNNQK